METAANAFDLPGCLKAATAIETDVTRLTTALTEAQFHAPPRTGGWSVGYCIEHLVLVGRALLPRWDIAIKQATRSKSDGESSFPYAWWQRRILHGMENPSRFKSRTPAAFEPHNRRSVEHTVEEFLSMHRELVHRFEDSRGLDLRHTKVQSHFVSWTRYSLGFSFDLALAHERRHLRQAMEVRHQLADEMERTASYHAFHLPRS